MLLTSIPIGLVWATKQFRTQALSFPFGKVLKGKAFGLKTRNQHGFRYLLIDVICVIVIVEV